MADLDPGLAALRDAAAGGQPMVALPLDEVRERIVTGDRLCSAGPAVDVTEFAAGEDGAPVPLRIYGNDHDTTLVYAHGGGWTTGGLDYADEFCRFLAADAHIRVVNVAYRLAPEHPFPAPLDDLAAVWHWTKEHFRGHVALGGDSAGGNLAAALTLRLRECAGPVFQLLLYPVLDMPDRSDSYVRQSDAFPIGAADMRWFFDHYVDASVRTEAGTDLSPLQAADLTGLPPTHLVVAGHDPLHDEGLAYARRLRDAGVATTVREHPELCHGFLRFTAASSAARDARAAAVQAVARLARDASDSTTT